MQVLDLSREIAPEMPVYPGTPSPGCQEICTLGQEGFRENILSFSTHTGTHIDFPAHMLETGATAEQINIKKFWGKGKVVDCSEVGRKIDKKMLEQEVEKAKYEFVLLYTGWGEKWGTKAYYSDYPCLTPEAAQFLTTLGLQGVGVDTLSVDDMASATYQVHKILLQQEIIILENLANLKGLVGKDFNLACFPLKFKKSDASPVRAAAILPRS